ncbi:hypothetical protein JXA32_10050 [Candidatus Sumerlaeota bacterium]|nr:hypothetical protein [Candidatus Sumerlaeota bacterium]
MSDVVKTHKDKIDIKKEYQTIRNFGASDCWSMQKIGAWSPKNRERVAELLFSKYHGIGLSCWRFNFGGGLNDKIHHPWRTAETFEVAEGQYDWNHQANEQWFLRAAKRYGVNEFVAFVNSPPRRLTANNLTGCSPDGNSTNLKKGYEGQFARYICDILSHFENHPNEESRIHFDYISPINEPEHEWNGGGQEGCRYAIADIKAVVKELHKELRRQGLTTKILSPEAGSPRTMCGECEWMSEKFGTKYGDYIDELCSDPEMAECLSKQICYHAYWADNAETNRIVEAREVMRKKMDKYPDWELHQTEYCVMAGPHSLGPEAGGFGRDLSMITALWVSRVMHYDMSVANANAWQWWTSFSPEDYKDGLIHTDYFKEGDPESIIVPKLLWTFGNFSRFVRPGAKRVELTGDGHDRYGLLGSAYKDEAEKKIVAVYLNMADIRAQVKLNIAGAKIKAWSPFVTSFMRDDNLKQYPDIAAGEEITIPARAVVTLIANYE